MVRDMSTAMGLSLDVSPKHREMVVTEGNGGGGGSGDAGDGRRDA